jgi:hypothetical protein
MIEKYWRKFCDYITFHLRIGKRVEIDFHYDPHTWPILEIDYNPRSYSFGKREGKNLVSNCKAFYFSIFRTRLCLL